MKFRTAEKPVRECLCGVSLDVLEVTHWKAPSVGSMPVSIRARR